MPKYYGIQRTNEYLAHYGVKGMKWGVRKAIERGDAKALARHYRKATKKLNKLRKKESIAENKAIAERFGKIAKNAAKIGATGLGIATGSHIGYEILDRKILKSMADRRNNQDYWNQVEKIRKQNGNKPDYITMNDPSLQPYYERDERLKRSIDSDSNKMRVADRIRTAGGIIGAGGLAVAGASGIKAGLAKYRMSSKGHAKAVQKRKKWEEEMRTAFKGTKYAKLPNTGFYMTEARKAAKRKKWLNGFKQDLKDSALAAAISPVAGISSANIIRSRREAIGDNRNLITGKKLSKKRRRNNS